MASRVRLDSAGLAEVLRSGEVRGALSELAYSTAANAGDYAGMDPIPVEVRERVASGGRLRGERPAFDVTLAHPAALRVEAKRGTLLRAAASAGLEVKSLEATS